MTNNFSPSSIARLGENHGYRFEGDFVHLNAEVNFADAELADAGVIFGTGFAPHTGGPLHHAAGAARLV